MNNNVIEILKLLNVHHPNAVCELNYNSTFELLVAVILSAQCTDKRVNIITSDLFKKYNTPKDFSELTVEELSPLIFSAGFYRNKAKNIISCSREILYNYNGVVPEDIEELVKLHGVGYKTASVMKSVAFNGDAIAVDTHVYRVSKRLGLATANTPLKVMKELMSSFNQAEWSKLHHLLLHHGRYICKSRRPLCKECKLTKYCNYYKELEGKNE